MDASKKAMQQALEALETLNAQLRPLPDSNACTAIAVLRAALARTADDEYEMRADGNRVRKDRWEVGIRCIVAILWGNRKEFEIDEVVETVRELVPAPFAEGDDEALVRAVLGQQEQEQEPVADEREAMKAEYGRTDAGFTIAGIETTEGDKRLLALLVRALGSDHPAVDDLVGLLFSRRVKAPQPEPEQKPGGVCARCGGWVCDPVLKLAQQEQELYTLAEYTGDGFRRQWVTVGAWLTPGERIVHLGPAPRD